MVSGAEPGQERGGLQRALGQRRGGTRTYYIHTYGHRAARPFTRTYLSGRLFESEWRTTCDGGDEAEVVMVFDGLLWCRGMRGMSGCLSIG